MEQPLDRPDWIEGVLNKIPSRWLITLVGEEQSRQLATLTHDLRGKVSTTGDGKKISSGFSYWGIGPTIAWTHACNDPFYLVMKESIDTFPSRFARIFRHIKQQHYHYVSLGVGTGHKDRQILVELYKAHPGLFFFPVDMSPEMLRIGTQEAVKGIPIGHSKVLPLQIDFSIIRNVDAIRHLLNQIVGEEPILFSLLGNTLANFEGDATLLKILARLLRPQDRLMLEIAYTDTLSVDAVQEAIEEYSRSRAFKEFVTSALLQNTNLYIGTEDVSFDGSIDGDKAIQIKVLYQNKTGSSKKILLPDRSEIDFPVEDTIRLYLTRKYTSHGIEALLNECGFLPLTQELSMFYSAYSSYNFGMAAMLLQPAPSSSKNSSRWESAFISYGSPDQAFAEKLNKVLTERGVKTYFFARNNIPGEKAYQFMRQGVDEYDHTILVCSQQSLDRLPVLNELKLVLARESREGGSNRLIPVTLDRYVYDSWSPGENHLKTSVLDRSVCDFIGGDSDETKFTTALEQLLLALRPKDE
jgi:L-histidine N-alpha-methyltransferase